MAATSGVKLGSVALEIVPEVNAAAFRAAAARIGTEFSQAVARGVNSSLGQHMQTTMTSMGNLGRAAQTASRDVVRGMNDASSAVSRLSTQIGLTSFGFQLIGQNIERYVTMPMAAAVTATTKFGLQSAAELEKNAVLWKSVTNESEGYEDQFKQLVQLAVDSPVFQTEDLSKYSAQMVAAGMETEKVLPLMDSLGNLFLSTGVDANQSSLALLALTQMFAKGKITGEELNRQLRNAWPGGFEIFKQAAQNLGRKGMMDLVNAIENGEITMSQFFDELQRMGQSEEVLKRAAEGAKTLSAQWTAFREGLKVKIASAFLDENFRVKPEVIQSFEGFSNLVGGLANAFVAALPRIQAAFDTVVNKLEDLKRKYEELTPKQQEQVQTFLAIAAAAGPLSSALGVAGIAVGTLTRGLAFFVLNPVGLIIGGIALAIAGLGAAFVVAYRESEEFRKGVEAFVEAVKRGWNETILPAFDRLKAVIKDELIPAFTDLILALGFDSWEEFGRWLGETLIASLEELIEKVRGGITIFTDIMETITQVIEHFKSMKQTWDDFWQALDTASSNIRGVFSNLASAVTEQFLNPFKGAIEAAKAEWRSFIADLGNTGAANAGSGLANAISAEVDQISAKLKQAWEDIKNVARQAWQDLGSTISGVWRETIKPAWDEFTNSLSSAWNDKIKPAWDSLRASLRELWDSIKPIIDDLKSAWNQLSDNIRDAWNDKIKPALDGLGKAWDDLEKQIGPAVDKIKKAWEDLNSEWDKTEGKARSLTDALKGIWDAAGPGLQLMATLLAGAVLAGILGFIQNLTHAIEVVALFTTSSIQHIENLANVISTAYNNIIRPALEALNVFIRDELIPLFARLLASGKEAWDNLAGAIGAAWNLIRDTVFTPVVNFIRDTLIPAFRTLKDDVTRIFEELKTAIGGVFSRIKDEIYTPAMNFVKNDIPAAFNTAKDAVIGVWNSLHSGLMGIWDRIVNDGRGKINGLIGLINGVIRIINKIPGITAISELSGLQAGGPIGTGANAPGRSAFRRHGGPVEGGPMGVDTVPAIGPGGRPYRLDNGEHILTRHEVSKMGGHKSVYAFRKRIHSNPSSKVQGLMKGDRYRDGVGLFEATAMATGGRVGADNNSLLEGHRDHVHVAMSGPNMSWPKIVEKAKEAGVSFSVTSTYRPGSRGSGGGLDHHSEGRAVDFGGFNQDKFASFWERTPGVIELIHRTNQRDYAIFGGGGGGGFVSFLQTAAGKLLKKAFDAALGPLKAAIPQPNGMVWSAINALFKTIPDALVNTFTSNADAGGGGAAAPEQLKKWIEEAKKYVSIEWEEGLITLIMRESGGNPRAINNWDSNAAKGTPSKGLMQTIDPTFQAYRNKSLPNDPFDPVANIVAGMNYVHSRYGSLRNVQQANSKAPARGYDVGGILPPGRTVVDNNTGRPEYIFNPSQWRILKDNISQNSARLGDINIELTQHEDYVDARITHRDEETTRRLRTGRRRK